MLLLQDMGVSQLPPTVLHCDNQVVLAIAANRFFHKRTKHIEGDRYFIRDKLNSGFMITHHVPSDAQLVDILTKSLLLKRHNYLKYKLGSSGKSHVQLESE